MPSVSRDKQQTSKFTRPQSEFHVFVRFSTLHRVKLANQLVFAFQCKENTFRFYQDNLVLVIDSMGCYEQRVFVPVSKVYHDGRTKHYESRALVRT